MKQTKAKKGYLFFTDNKFILISGLCALVLMLLVYYCYDLIPFGDMTILRMDLYHQYGPLFAELYDRLTSGGSLLYSWETGLGGSFLGNFFNYLSSPFSFIILLFGHENIPEAISVMILLKAVLSACSFTYYLKKSFGQSSAGTAAFGVLYAFCGYFIAYYWNVMWLDAMYLFPLVMLGIERIIQKGRPTLYCVSLALTFITNYYMAYMVCIFSVLYFLTFYFSHHTFSETFCEAPITAKKPNFIRRCKNSRFFCSGWKFAFYSALAVGLVAMALFPLIEVLSSSSATSGTAPTDYKKYFAVFDFLANHLASTEPTIRSSGSDVLPNVYSGILTLLCVPLYLFCSKISVREKIAHVCLLGILYFSFSINYLNFFWHGMHFPNDLPYRFSFMYTFVLLIMAYKALTHIRSFSAKQIVAVGVGVVAFIILVEKITSKNVTDASLLLSLIFAIGYVCILYLFRSGKAAASAISILLLCTTVSEIALSTTTHYTMNQSKPHYTEDYADFRALKTKLDEYDGSFYRMELTDLRTRMDPSWYNYNGVSVFSSMAYEKTANLQRNIGMFGNYINSYTYHLQTPVYNAMFGLKYVVNNNGVDMNPLLYKELFSSGKFTAYENNYALPVAFCTSADVADWTVEPNKDPFLQQQQWFYLATGVENVFRELKPTDIQYNNLSSYLDGSGESDAISFSKTDKDVGASFTFEMTPERTEDVFVYIKSAQADTATATIGEQTKEVNTSDGYIVDLGVCAAGVPISIEIPVQATESEGSLLFYAYALDMNAFKRGYEGLADDGQFQLSEYKDTKLTGILTADENEIVYTSIPYDKNWQVFVDGKRIYANDILAVSDGLLAFNIGAGTHTVSLIYTSPGLLVGCYVTIASIVIATFLIICRRREWLFYRKKNTEKWSAHANETPAEAAKASEPSVFSEYLGDLDVIVEERRKTPPTAPAQPEAEPTSADTESTSADTGASSPSQTDPERTE